MRDDVMHCVRRPVAPLQPEIRVECDFSLRAPPEVFTDVLRRTHPFPHPPQEYDGGGACMGHWIRPPESKVSLHGNLVRRGDDFNRRAPCSTALKRKCPGCESLSERVSFLIK